MDNADEQQIKFAKKRSDVAIKRDEGDEKLEEWKKERLLEKRMFPLGSRRVECSNKRLTG